MPATLYSYAGKPCPYCGRTMAYPPDAPNIGWTPSRDHIIPKSAGGTRAQSNITVVCRRCNNERGNRTLELWVLHLEEANDPRLERVRDFLEWREPLIAEEGPIEPPARPKRPNTHHELIKHLFDVHQHGVEPMVKIRYAWGTDGLTGTPVEDREPARHDDLDDARRPADPAE